MVGWTQALVMVRNADLGAVAGCTAPAQGAGAGAGSTCCEADAGTGADLTHGRCWLHQCRSG